MVEEVLADWTAIAHWAAEVDARQRIAAFAARHQPLRNTGGDCPTRRKLLVLRQQLPGLREGILVNENRDCDLDPFRLRPLSVSTVARDDPAGQAKRPCDALTRCSRRGRLVNVRPNFTVS
jgi:hypothetical protein